jgi:hypothetical protein
MDDRADPTPTAAEPPELVRRFLARVVPDDLTVPARVRVTQQGQMWQKLDAKPIGFTATQDLAVDRVAFLWRASFPILGPLAIKVVDSYDDGVGRLEARVLRFPIVRQSGPETSVGEALRYLAELPWVPFAIMRNRELGWRELAGQSVEVACNIGTERAAVTLELDDAGDVVGTSCRARPRQVGKKWVPTPWSGKFGDYRDVGGVRIPTSAEVRWELRAGPFTYWRGTVTSLELDPA